MLKKNQETKISTKKSLVTVFWARLALCERHVKRGKEVFLFNKDCVRPYGVITELFFSIQKCWTSKQWGNLASENKKPIKKLLVLEWRNFHAELRNF